MKKYSPVVAIVHPAIRNGYTDEDMQKLSGYDLLEVLNHHRNAEAKWDAALSAGKTPWIIANDDSHDISLQNETGVSWTMIDAQARQGSDILNALASGRAYAVTGNKAKNDHYLKDVSVSGNTVRFRVDSTAQKITLIGQNGAVRREVSNSDSAIYTFMPEDHYIRAVIKFASITMYLNPVFRFDGKQVPVNANVSFIDPLQTLLVRLLIFFIWAMGVILILLLNRNWTSRLINFRFRSRRRVPDAPEGTIGMA